MLDWIKPTYKEVTDEMYVYQRLPLLDVLEDGKTVTLKDGYSVSQVLSISGVDYTGMSIEDRRSYQNIREALFSNLPEGLKLNTVYIRKKERFSEPEHDFGSRYAAEINRRHINSFTESYRTYIYLVVTLTDNSFLTKTGIASQSYNKESLRVKELAHRLGEHVADIMSVLDKFNPEYLYHNTDRESDLLAFWSYIVNGSNEDLATPRQGQNLNEILPVSTIDFTTKTDKKWERRLKEALREVPAEDTQSKKALEDAKRDISALIKDIESKGNRPYVRFSDRSGERYAGFVFVKYYPHELDEGLLEDILSVEHRFNVSLFFKSVNSQQKVQEYMMKRDRSINLGATQYKKAEEFNDVAQRVSAGEFQVVENAISFCVYGDTVDEVDDGITKLAAVVARHHINLVKETTNTEATFWSIFPNYDLFLDPRKAEITSIAAAALCTFGTRQQGLTRCAFGEMPVTYYKQARGGQQYAFTFHPTPEDGAPGHTLIVGGTGSGKSVTMAHLIASSLKYKGRTREEGPLRAMIFDSLNGLKVPINALGGEYIDFAEHDVPLNPMKLSDTPENRRFLRDWIAILSRSKSDGDYEIINRLVKTNFDHINFEDRSLHALVNTMGVAQTDAATGEANFAKRMREWLPSQDNPNRSEYPYGMAFNADHDALDFDNRIVGFDMTEVLKSDQLLAPLTSYIFHTFMEYTSKNPCPHLLFMDEALNFVGNDYFYPFIQQALLEFRKRNGVFAAAVQDVGYLYETKNGEDFIRSFPSYIIFPNPSATEQYYMGDNNKSGLGLTRAEFEWVKNSDQRRCFMLKRKDGPSVILNADLSHLGEYLHLLRGDKSVLTEFNRIQEMSQSDIAEQGYEDWQEMFLAKMAR